MNGRPHNLGPKTRWHGGAPWQGGVRNGAARKRSRCTTKKSAALVEVHRTQETFLTTEGAKVTGLWQITISFRPGPKWRDQRALSDRPMCFHGSFASQMGCSTARDTPGQSLLSPSSTSPTGYSPLNPLISSRVFGSTAIDSVGGTAGQTDEQSELCYLALNPVYESSFFLCPKRDTSTSTTITRRWRPISLEGKRRGRMDTDTKRPWTTKHPIDLTNTAKRTAGRSYERSLESLQTKVERVSFVPSPTR